MHDAVRRPLVRAACLVAIVAASLSLAACGSNYDGPITNEAPHDATQGPPGLTNGFAP